MGFDKIVRISYNTVVRYSNTPKHWLCLIHRLSKADVMGSRGLNKKNRGEQLGNGIKIKKQFGKIPKIQPYNVPTSSTD